jgi:hypothetical protein
MYRAAAAAAHWIARIKYRVLAAQKKQSSRNRLPDVRGGEFRGIDARVDLFTGLRDLGMGARGFFLKDKLQYRFGVFQGEREANARNSLRTSGYVQYDFFDSETGYTFAGRALGKKKILGLDAGFDAQGSYHGASANLALRSGQCMRATNWAANSSSSTTTVPTGSSRFTSKTTGLLKAPTICTESRCSHSRNSRTKSLL